MVQWLKINLPIKGAVGLISRSGKSPGVEMATHSSILAWEIHGQGSLEDYSPWSCKESDMI